MTQEVLQQALNQPGGGRIVNYKDMTMVVPIDHIKEAISNWERYGEKRKTMMISVNRELEKTYSKMLDESANQQEVNEFVQDLVIWLANEIIEGRQNLSDSVQ